MVTFWYAKVKVGMCELSDVRDVYYEAVLARLVAEGLYDEQGNKLK